MINVWQIEKTIYVTMRNHTLETLPAFFSHFSQTILISQKNSQVIRHFLSKTNISWISKKNNYFFETKTTFDGQTDTILYFKNKIYNQSVLFWVIAAELDTKHSQHWVERAGRFKLVFFMFGYHRRETFLDS